MIAQSVTFDQRLLQVDEYAIAEIITRASSIGYDRWWARVTAAGYCASPIHLTRSDETGSAKILVRCKNRRQAVCPSCSDLYAGDTWHLVHAGLGGGHDVPKSVSTHPKVFITLTAPSFGAVHSAGPLACTSTKDDTYSRPRLCRHGRPMECHSVHDGADELIGQPICPDCYDYVGHVLFTWHSPELWARFTLTLRRMVRRELVSRGESPKALRVSFVKVVEMQRRGAPHFHSVIRLDSADVPSKEPPQPPATTITADALAGLARQATISTQIEVPGLDRAVRTLAFGSQMDAQILPTPGKTNETASPVDSGSSSTGRRVAGYLAKYVTKSVADFGLAPRRISPDTIDYLPVSDHFRNLLRTIVLVAADSERERMLDWLHALGYRGHITTKSRGYSTTMTALRARRAEYRQESLSQRLDGPLTGASLAITSTPDMPAQSDSEWQYEKHGHATSGERLLAVSAAVREREARWAARQLADFREGAGI
ncbi:replication initiator [Cryobacterium sp. MDB2-33-2]|uniref:replication initiator n=1 Tax=Cryobacterium sp. MDB2-33-2 TaxID=1259179 RepID=UPI001069DD41|nr:replication initiator [Cryobacterium sp. MDB2-33-2]TFC08474.1 plasmid replication initiator protein [Cryobacterium sp. MDB2-33-2]